MSNRNGCIAGVTKWFALAIGVLVGMLQPAYADRNLNPGALSIQSKAFGMSYGEWNAGKFGPVWFLGGTFSSTPDPGDPNAVIDTANRVCKVPAGKALTLLPAASSWTSMV